MKNTAKGKPIVRLGGDRENETKKKLRRRRSTEERGPEMHKAAGNGDGEEAYVVPPARAHPRRLPALHAASAGHYPALLLFGLFTRFVAFVVVEDMLAVCCSWVVAALGGLRLQPALYTCASSAHTQHCKVPFFNLHATAIILVLSPSSS